MNNSVKMEVYRRKHFFLKKALCPNIKVIYKCSQIIANTYDFIVRSGRNMDSEYDWPISYNSSPDINYVASLFNFVNCALNLKFIIN